MEGQKGGMPCFPVLCFSHKEWQAGRVEILSILPVRHPCCPFSRMFMGFGAIEPSAAYTALFRQLDISLKDVLVIPLHVGR